MNEHFSDCPGGQLVEWQGRLGDWMRTCETCGKHSRATPSEPQSATARAHYLLVCVRCERAIPLSRPDRRVPLCDRCKTTPRPRRRRQERFSDYAV